MIDWENVAVSAVGVIASGFVAVWQARRTAKLEIEKLKAVWEHEKEIAHDSDFDNMVAAVSLFVRDGSRDSFQAATKAVAIYRAKAPKELAGSVDKLSWLMTDTNTARYDVEEQLDKIISDMRGTRA